MRFASPLLLFLYSEIKPGLICAIKQAKKLLRTAGDGSDPSLSKIHTLLHLQHARSEASRVTYKAAPTPKAPRVGPYPGAPKLVDVRPLPLEKLYGRRHVPTLTHANGYPFLRTSKPQSAFLSRMLRNKIDSKDQRHKRLQNYEKDVEVGKDEEAWEGLVGRVLEREVGIWAREEWMGSEDRDSGQVRGSWFEESLRAKEEVKYYLWEDLQKAKKLGDRMTEVVESERRLWWQERGRRRIEKKAAKKEKGGLVGAEALDEDRR